MMKKQNAIFPIKDSGFSLIELLVCLAILGIIMTFVLSSYTGTMRRSVQQSNIAETEIETGLGLDLLRLDLEHAGFGLPWQFSSGTIAYLEPAPSDSPNVPKAFSSADSSTFAPNTTSDYLSIRATNVLHDLTSQKWGYVGRDINHVAKIQSLTDDVFDTNVTTSEKVIVIEPQTTLSPYRKLIMSGSSFFTTPVALASFAPPATPNDPDGVKYFVYGLKSEANPNNIKRPFNRVDYYISSANVPTHCAPNTGVLVKAILNQADNGFSVMPIVDCVADFQVVYYLDTNGDGGWNQRTNANGLTTLSAEEIRDQVKIVHCYILTHEGSLDRSYSYPNTTINVGEVDASGNTLVANAGRSFDIKNTIGGNWANYRWKLKSLAVSPLNIK